MYLLLSAHGVASGKVAALEDGAGLWLFLLGILFFGMPTAICYRRRLSASSVPSEASPKVQVVQRALDAVVGSITSNLERTEITYHPSDPDDVITFIMDIEQFRHMRRKRGLWEHQGIFAEREIERRWFRRPPAVREWEGIELVVPLLVETAFEAGPDIWTVRVWIGDMEKGALTICRVSVEAHDDADAPGEYDWRFDKRAKGYLAPVTPHGDSLPQLSAVGLAEDPYDFEQQVAQMLRGRGLVVEVTGGSGDGGVDIIAYDGTPVTGGTFLVQCKRYSQDHKVGVAEVRELYGTMSEKQSAKGVLVTSSAFTAGALKFAEGKAIELIDGGRLSELVAAITQPVPDAFLAAFDEEQDTKAKESEGVIMSDDDARDLLRGLGQMASEAGDSIDMLRQHALFLAVIEGDTESLEDIIQQGVDVNARSATAGEEHAIGALHYAAFYGHEDAVRVLLGAGADVNIRNANGYTPLHFAVPRGHVEVVRLLLDAGADVNALSSDGHSPIGGAVVRVWENGHLDQDDEAMIEELVSSGADTRAARSMAMEEGLTDVLDLLGGPEGQIEC